MKKCPYCSAQLNDDSLFCTECGKPFPQSNVCPYCGANMNEGDMFCHNCGKKQNELPSIVTDSTLRKCQFCGAEINEGDAFCQSCGQVIRPSLPDLIEHKANFNSGLTSIGGKIIITPTQLIFRAHAINFGNLNDRIYEIKDITGYKKGALTFLYISFSNGKDIKLTVWNKDEIINQLEERRRALICNSEIVNPTQCNVCPHCGASMNDGDAFCGNCGANLQANVSSNQKDEEMTLVFSDKMQNELSGTYSPSAYQTDNISRTDKITFDGIKRPIIWTLCVLLLIGGSIGGWYYYKKITAENEQAQWEKIKDTEELKDLENFLRQYPNGKYKVKAQERSQYVQEEISRWNNVARTNNPEELKGFFNKYKKGYYHNLAVEAYDELLWSLATRKNDLQSYRYYLEECPQGKHFQHAKEKADYQEKVSLDESEAEHANNVVSRYFYAIARGDESGMLECLSSDLKSFMGKSSATKVDAIEYMHRLHADDVYSIDITMGEYEIKKTLDSQGEPQYTIDFSYDQRLNREDTSLETFASYKGTAVLNSLLKISSLSLTKIAKY